MADLQSQIDLVTALADQGRHEQARAALQRLTARHPREPLVWLLASRLAFRVGDGERAAFAAQRAGELAPGEPYYPLQLAFVLQRLTKRYKDSEAAARRSIALDPTNPQAHALLGSALLEQHAYIEAADALLAALKTWPENDELAATAGMALLQVLRPREAVEVMERARAANPDSIKLAEPIAVTYNFVPNADPRRVADAHRTHGRLLTQAVSPLGPLPAAKVRAPAERTRLRIGILSPEFRLHSVAFFLRPIFEHLSRDSFELYAYYTSKKTDEHTEWFKSRADQWREFTMIGTLELAQRLRDDDLDVLIECAGLTGDHRLDALALHPAPVQVTYLGYPNTTGLEAMDARIVDSITDPIEPLDGVCADELATERLVRLDPCFICYAPPDQRTTRVPAALSHFRLDASIP